jgi:hypothetical protein
MLTQKLALMELTVAQEHVARDLDDVAEVPSMLPVVPELKAHPEIAGRTLPPMSEQSSIKLPTPLVNYKEPLLTLQEWDTWHEQVINEVCKNAQGTHLAITSLMRDEGKHGPIQLRQFRTVVMHMLLRKQKPTVAREGFQTSFSTVPRKYL